MDSRQSQGNYVFLFMFFILFRWGHLSVTSHKQYGCYFFYPKTSIVFKQIEYEYVNIFQISNLNIMKQFLNHYTKHFIEKLPFYENYGNSRSHDWCCNIYAKNYFINEYTLTCLLTDCFLCQQS